VVVGNDQVSLSDKTKSDAGYLLLSESLICSGQVVNFGMFLT
jgi:hypothetical protein